MNTLFLLRFHLFSFPGLVLQWPGLVSIPIPFVQFCWNSNSSAEASSQSNILCPCPSVLSISFFSRTEKISRTVSNQTIVSPPPPPYSWYGKAHKYYPVSSLDITFPTHNTFHSISQVKQLVIYLKPTKLCTCLLYIYYVYSIYLTYKKKGKLKHVIIYFHMPQLPFSFLLISPQSTSQIYIPIKCPCVLYCCV